MDKIHSLQILKICLIEGGNSPSKCSTLDYFCLRLYDLFHYLFFINSNNEDFLKKAHQLQEMFGRALSTSELATQFENTVF